MELNALYEHLKREADGIIVEQRIVSTESGWHDTRPVIDDLAWARSARDLELAVEEKHVDENTLRALEELFMVQYGKVLQMAAEKHISEGGWRSSELHELRALNQQISVMHGLVLHILRIMAPAEPFESLRQAA